MRNAIVITTTTADATETKKIWLDNDSSVNINISMHADEEAAEPEPEFEPESTPEPASDPEPEPESEPEPEPEPEPTPELEPEPELKPEPTPVIIKPSHDVPPTVVCFGDSLTSINSFPEHYSWTTTVQDNRPDLNIINSGRFGGFTYDVMKSDKKTLDMAALTEAILKYNPSGVLITLGGNDITTSTENPRVIFERYQTIVNFLRNDYKTKVVMGLYELTAKQCQKIVAGGAFPHSKVEMKLRFSSYNQLIKGWAPCWKEPQPVISIYSYLKDANKEVPEEYLRPGDAVHLSQEAAEIVGNGITNTLSDWFDWLE